MKNYIIAFIILITLLSCGDGEDMHGSAEAKLRDANRNVAMMAIDTAIYMYYQDNNDVFPESLDDIVIYMGELPRDVLVGTSIDKCTFGYTYERLEEGKQYRLSTCVESDEYLEKAKNDGGTDKKRLERTNGMNWLN